jgi:hypothetical protein
MAPGSLSTMFDDRDPPLSKTVGLMADMEQMGQGPFGQALAHYLFVSLVAELTSAFSVLLS